MPDTGIGKVLISQKEIQKIVTSLGREITQHYSKNNRELIVIGLLKGSFVFMADLIRSIDYPLTIDFLAVSSYSDAMVSSGDVKVVMDICVAIDGKDVLLVEDIIDTGYTLQKVVQLLEARKPASLKVCTFLSKPSRREVDVPIDFCGKDIPDEFVCGYGLDYAQKYRNLPYVGVLEKNGL
jgi:hypoxanthine phosphoribosyltransferase